MIDSNLLWLCVVLLLGITILFLIIFYQSQFKAREKEVEELKQQCVRLREELNQQSKQLNSDFRNATFEQLKTVVTNYPTIRKIAQEKPDLPAKNLIALFTPLDNLLSNWGYEAIGTPWEQVAYHPQLHKPDNKDIAEGELVYIRFIGYRDKESNKILSPAQVSRTLPGANKK